MHGTGQRVLLRHYLKRGLIKTEVARELGISRRTVYDWIATGQLDREFDEAPVRYTPRPPMARKIDAFRGIIKARLCEFPKLTATRLLDEGARPDTPAATRNARSTCARCPPRRLQILWRFKTPPGQQAQVDSPSSGHRGVNATRSWWCSPTRACCGCSSVLARRFSASALRNFRYGFCTTAIVRATLPPPPALTS